jgi:hypothetical protein
VLVALSALLLALFKSLWLPFLDRTVFPSGVLSLNTPANANIKIKVNVKPNTKVVYWAAYGKDKDKQNVSEAYKDYTNSGVVMSDSNGVAELSLIEGGGYNVPLRHIKRHVHYRVFGETGGMLSAVKTVFY